MKPCEFANCVVMVPPGEGTRVNFAGFRKTFCSQLHAAWYLLDWPGNARMSAERMWELAAADPHRVAKLKEGGAV